MLLNLCSGITFPCIVQVKSLHMGPKSVCARATIRISALEVDKTAPEKVRPHCVTYLQSSSHTSTLKSCSGSNRAPSSALRVDDRLTANRNEPWLDGPGWMGLWASWSSGRCPCPWQGVGTRWSLRSLLTQTILWVYDSMILWFYGAWGQSYAPCSVRVWTSSFPHAGRARGHHEVHQQSQNIPKVKRSFFFWFVSVLQQCVLLPGNETIKKKSAAINNVKQDIQEQ